MANESGKYRLVTRSDFDGLVCAAILKDLDLIDDVKFVHPKDMQDGKVEITNKDITTNLPYVESCYLAFDHHSSEALRTQDLEAKNFINDPAAHSAARVVYNYYGGKEKLTNISVEMMDAVDKSDSAQFTKEEIMNPTKWVLLSFLMDPRTGLGRFRTFRIANYQLMMDMIDYCRKIDVEEILKQPDVKDRVDLYFSNQDKFKDQLKKNTKIDGNVAILDLRKEEVIFPGNRFMIYALFPECNISIHVLWGFRQQNTALAVGKSILNRSSDVNIGDLMLKYGGGGHKNSGTCQVDNDKADDVIKEIVTQINASA